MPADDVIDRILNRLTLQSDQLPPVQPLTNSPTPSSTHSNETGPNNAPSPARKSSEDLTSTTPSFWEKVINVIDPPAAEASPLEEKASGFFLSGLRSRATSMLPQIDSQTKDTNDLDQLATWLEQKKEERRSSAPPLRNPALNLLENFVTQKRLQDSEERRRIQTTRPLSPRPNQDNDSSLYMINTDALKLIRKTELNKTQKQLVLAICKRLDGMARKNYNAVVSARSPSDRPRL